MFLIIYYIAPPKLRNLILFIASLIFYAWGEPVYVVIMIFSTLLDYTVGRIIDAFRTHTLIPKIALGISLCGNLGMLGFFKYADFFIANLNNFFNLDVKLLEIALPIGISFYTFQTMSYTIDVYRGKAGVQKNIISFGAYVAMFPQLIAGPIVTYTTVEKELNARHVSADLFCEGVLRFIEGLGKKVLLANNIGLLWEQTKVLPAKELSCIGAWIGILAFALQIYFDFSGYSDMAIGLGKMLGFNFPENFNFPYIASSVTEFWRRWHMTLGSWFREYVYIPLGGNRVNRSRLMVNIFVVWFLTGFWHGAGWNFILWGLFFALLLVIEKFFLLNCFAHKPKWIGHAYLILTVLISWVFFALESVSEISSYFKAMFGLGEGGFLHTTTLYALSNFSVILIISCFFALPIMKKVKKRLPILINYLGYVAILIFSTAYLVDATFNPFLYFRF
jgi:alginate O-acetyltransferase complex protein AlgI